MTLALPGLAGSMIEYQWRDREVIRTTSHGDVVVDAILVNTPDTLALYEAELSAAPDIAHDTETSGLIPALGARAVGFCNAWMPTPHHLRAFYLPIRHVGEQTTAQLPVQVVLPVMSRVLSSPGKMRLHHAKFDLGMARADGIRWTRDVRDVSVEAVIHDENEDSFGLKQLSAKYLNPHAREEEKLLEEWLKRDARSLGMPYKKRRAGDEGVIGPATYLERFGYSRAPIQACGIYGCHDAAYTMLLPKVFASEVAKYSPLYERELKVSDALLDMEWFGLEADAEAIRSSQLKAEHEANYWLEQIRRMLGEPNFEPTDAALRDLFYTRLKMDLPKETKSGAGSVDKEARAILAAGYPEHAPLINTIGEHAKIEKISTTYGSAFLRFWSPTTKSIHPSYNQLEEREEGGVPVTGRLSSQNPNIQNVAKKPIHLIDCGCAKCCEAWSKGKLLGPKRNPGLPSTLSIRRYFTVPMGFVRIYIDFSQIELRVLAWYSRDPILLNAYANDLDIHKITSEEVTEGDRDVAKQVNFGNSYGMTEIGLAKRMAGYAEDPEGTRAKAAKVLERFFQRYAGIPKFRDALSQHMRENGGSFVSAMGRPRRIEELLSTKRWERERGERKMMSSAISGTAADMMKEVLIRCRAYLASIYGPMEHTGIGAKQTIHDEIVYDIPIKGCDRTIHGLAHYTNYWPMFSEHGVPIKAGLKVTTTTWEDAREVLLQADGSVVYAPK